MTIPLKVEDITSYLAEGGWSRDPQDWRGASVWRHSGDYEVLVPAQDGLGDGDRRLREILRCLSTLEDRAVGDIALEIARPQLDKQLFRTFPAGHDAGYTSLRAGVQVAMGIRNLFNTATRTVVEGPHFVFAGRAPGAVNDLARAAELGSSRAGSYLVELRVAADAATRTEGGEEILGRSVLIQMLESVSAARTAVLEDQSSAFGDVVTAGVSADLCSALSELAGPDHDDPFEIDFRWARSRPLDRRPQAVAFPAGSGGLLRTAAGRLRRLNASGPATVSGVIEGLHDDAAGNDRWRIKVRGELRTEHGQQARQSVWVRLADESAYNRAFVTHSERRAVTVAGELSSTTGRVELVPAPGSNI